MVIKLKPTIEFSVKYHVGQAPRGDISTVDEGFRNKGSTRSVFLSYCKRWVPHNCNLSMTGVTVADYNNLQFAQHLF